MKKKNNLKKKKKRPAYIYSLCSEALTGSGAPASAVWVGSCGLHHLFGLYH